MNNSKFWNSQKSYTGGFSISNRFNFSKKGLTNLFIGLLILGSISLVLFVTIGKPLLVLKNDGDIIKQDLKIISQTLKDRNLVDLNKAITKTQIDLNTFAQDRDQKLGWAKNVSLFKISEYYSDSDRFIRAANYGLDALKETSEISKPFADAAGLKLDDSNFGELANESSNSGQGLMEAFQTWISIMPDVASQLDPVIDKVAKAGKELQAVETSKYPESLGGTEIRSRIEFVKNTLVHAEEYGPDIKRALTVFPKVLGVGTPEKRYMIIMQNDKEIRATGGFMTNYATFKIANGLLQSDFSSKDMYSIDRTLDIIDATYDFPDPPAALLKYLRVERWYARDMNYSPDFITSMDQFIKFYNLAGKIDPFDIKPIDGIVAIDTQVVKEMLEVTGPVTVNGITYTPENVVLELEKIASLELREQANRKKVLGNLMQAMLVNVFESDKDLWPKLITKGIDLAIRKHVLVYLFDLDSQQLIEKYNFAGRISQEVQGDYAAIISTNLGGDKTNWFTTKKVTHTLAKEGENYVRTIQVDYTYNTPAAEYAPFQKRFKDFVRVYVPVGSQVISVDGSEDGTGTDQERNKTVMTAYLEMGPGESKTLKFKYSLPAGVVNGDTYNLTIQKQPGIDKEIHVVQVNNLKQEITLDKDASVTFRLR